MSLLKFLEKDAETLQLEEMHGVLKTNLNDNGHTSESKQHLKT